MRKPDLAGQTPARITLRRKTLGRMKFVWWAWLCMIAMLPTVLHTQSRGGAIEGRLTDSSNAVIPGASVQVQGSAGFSRIVTTDAEGKYAINGLPGGRYSIQVDWPGFTPFRSQTFEVSGSGQRILDVKLTLSETHQEIRVEADGFEPVSVDANSNVSATILRGKDLESLPDDPDDLLADLQALAGPAVTPNGAQIFVDGFSGGRLPSKESIREIRINQNPFAAEYDLPGFGRIEIFTKPGNRQFHGQMSLKFSDALLDSRNPYSSAKAPYQSRDFDGNLEGPLWNHASFFFNADRRTIRQSSIVNATTLDDSLNVIRINQTIHDPQAHTTISSRLDHQISESNTLTARYEYTDLSQENAGTGGFSLLSRRRNTDDANHTLQLSDSALLNRNTTNETRFQYMRTHVTQHGDNTVPALNVLESFLGGGSQIGVASNIQNRYELQNYTSLIRGTHSLRVGGRLRVLSLADSSTQNYGGTFTFGGEIAPTLDGSGQVAYISSLERFRRTLLFQSEGLSATQIHNMGGGASQFSILGGDPLAKVVQADVGVFGQDDWRARPNLTLSFGLRYEAQSNIASHAGFAPRFGFAWDPAPNGHKKYHTVIRGGSGVFYEGVEASLTMQTLRWDGTSRQHFIIRNPPFFPQVPSAADLMAANVPQTLRSKDARMQSPYSIVSSIGVERDLPLRFKIATTFTHTRSNHLLLSRDITGGGGPFPNVYQYESAGVLNGNQIITNVSRSVGDRLSLYGYYAYGRVLANTDGPNTFPANQSDLRDEYGRASTDIRHRFVFGGSISGPWGYVLSPFVVGRSGAPFNITTGRDTNNDGLFTERPALAVNPLSPGVLVTPFGLFDPNPALGTLVIPRNYANGPALFTLNLRLNKTIGVGGSRSPQGAKRRKSKKQADSDTVAKIDENDYSSIFHTEKSDQRYNLTFSITARNVFNNVNRGIPVGSLSSPTFGTSNWLASSGNPYHPSYGNNRTLQLDVRLGF
jgi:hypothetical protein